jgi:putative nucleotidyltransferase with HDIG domain
MPSLPVTVTKVIEISNNPASSPVDLNKVISMDPVLMGRVLRLINSAYYGLSDKVTSLARAIIMLGINTVKNLALSTAVLGNLGNKENFQALNMQGFWRHSLAVGVISKHIAKVRKEDPKIHEEYFIAGLLHDIGKIPLNNIFSGEYIEIMGSADRENSPLFRAESQGLGLDHSEVGTMIGDAWKLGAELKDAISYHHRPSEYRGRYGNIMSTVHISNYFAILLEIGFSGDRYPEKIHESALEELGIEMDLLDDIEERVEAEIGKAEIFLNLNK